MASLLCPRAVRISSASSTLRVFPVAVAAGRAPYSCAAPTPLKNHQRPATCRSRSAIVASVPSSRFASRPTSFAIRCSSTASTASAPPPPDALTWNRFFDLRRKRRYINIGASVITALTAVGTLGPLLAQQDLDSWGAQVAGLDPMVVLGISTFAIAGGGWLCGPAFGNTMFSMWAGRRGWNKLIAQKEKSFYARIKRYRGDPALSSPQRPVPDYYGEKIGSVKDYRRWLKDQRAFNLKSHKNIV